MDKNFDKELFFAWIKEIYTWVDNTLFSVSALYEIILFAISAVLAFVLAQIIKVSLKKITSDKEFFSKTYAEVALRIVRERIMGVLCFIELFITSHVFEFLGFSNHLLRMFTSLVGAWVGIKLLSYLIRNRFIRNFVSGIIWIAAALNTVGLLEKTTQLLSVASVTIGETTISLYMILKGFIIFIIMLWMAKHLSLFTEKGLRKTESFSVSMRALVGKTVKISIYVVAVVITLNTVGIDLTAFAVFSGALGVGIGFGLQKVVANVISGFILHMDNSIRQGDTIAIDDKFGRVNSIGARYSSVTVWDGTEYLIPNEDFITNRVVNWTHSNSQILIYLDVGVSYSSDMDEVKKLILEAVSKVSRIVRPGDSKCFMKEFGDSSVNFRVSFWINDPQNGIINIKSEVLFNIWNSFKENNIEIPFPQRDVHMIKS